MQFNERDLNALHSKLRELFGPEGVEREDDEIRCTAGAATFRVTAGGDVVAEMPLHSFQCSGISSIVINEDAGTIDVESGDAAYRFHHPGDRA